jgi:hypothetical protein
MAAVSSTLTPISVSGQLQLRERSPTGDVIACIARRRCVFTGCLGPQHQTAEKPPATPTQADGERPSLMRPCRRSCPIGGATGVVRDVVATRRFHPGSA